MFSNRRMLLSVQENLVRTGHRLARDQITQSGVAAFLDRRIKADMVAAIAHQVKYPVRLKIHLVAISSISGSRPSRRSRVLRTAPT